MNLISSAAKVNNKEPHTMKAARLSLCCSALARKSSKSRLPSAWVLIGTTLNPAMTADYSRYERRPHERGQITYRGIRAVCADRYETNIAVTFSTRLMIRPDDRQSSVFASSTRIGLERARG